MSIPTPRRRRPGRASWPALVLLVSLLAAASAPAALAAAPPRQLLDEPLLEAVPDPRGNGRLFAVTADHRLLRSVDDGESWQEIGTDGGGLPAGGIDDLDVDPLQPDVLYAVPRTLELPVHRSQDGGETWQPTGGLSSNVWELSVAEAPAGDVTLIGAGDDRVFRSADRGETWTEAGDLGLEDTGFRPREPVLTDGRPDLVYLTGTFFVPGFCGNLCIQERLFRSLDGGATWTQLDLPFLEGPGHLRTDPREPNLLYAVAEAALYRSDDRGESWDPVSEVSPPTASDLLVDPRRPGALFRATSAAGVFHSPDRGETWRPVAPGFAPEGLRDLAFLKPSAGPATLFAAGQGGLWALEVAPPVPDGPSFTDPALAGFRVWVRISAGDGEALPVRAEAGCIPETLCVSGSLPGRSEVFVRIVGPKPNGNLWPTLVKFTTSRVEVWIEQLATGEVEYYDLPGATPGVDELDGLFDRGGFEP